MSTLHQLRDGLNDAWDVLLEGWQRLYRNAAGAITRFTPGRPEGTLNATDEQRDAALRNTGWGVLAAEVFDDADRVVIRLETPGMTSDGFDLQIIDNRLIVSGEKSVEREHTSGQYYVTECAYGCFERVIPLPDDVDADNTTANYRNGVLRVELPKAAAKRRGKVTVKST